MRSISVLATLLLLASCYYESSYPLGPADAATFDAALVGTWRGANPETFSDVLRVAAFEDGKYAVELQEKDKHDLLAAHITVLGQARFLNVRSLDPSEPLYVFIRYDWAGDTLVLRGVKDKAPPPLATPATLKRWLIQNIDSAKTYEEPLRLVRDVK